MFSPLTFHNAIKYQRVHLAKDLPVGQAFGNKRIIKQDEIGDVLSNGFENGGLKVRFYSHYLGTDNVEFNERSAENYLRIDIYIPHSYQK